MAGGGAVVGGAGGAAAAAGSGSTGSSAASSATGSYCGRRIRSFSAVSTAITLPWTNTRIAWSDFKIPRL